MFSREIIPEGEPVNCADRFVRFNGCVAKNKVQVMVTCHFPQGYRDRLPGTAGLFNLRCCQHRSIDIVHPYLERSTRVRRPVINKKVTLVVKRDLLEAGASTGPDAEPLCVNELTIH